MTGRIENFAELFYIIFSQIDVGFVYDRPGNAFSIDLKTLGIKKIEGIKE